jgi:hypothetical protein
MNGDIGVPWLLSPIWMALAGGFVPALIAAFKRRGMTHEMPPSDHHRARLRVRSGFAGNSLSSKRGSDMFLALSGKAAIGGH